MSCSIHRSASATPWAAWSDSPAPNARLAAGTVSNQINFTWDMNDVLGL